MALCVKRESAFFVVSKVHWGQAYLPKESILKTQRECLVFSGVSFMA